MTITDYCKDCATTFQHDSFEGAQDQCPKCLRIEFKALEEELKYTEKLLEDEATEKGDYEREVSTQVDRALEYLRDNTDGDVFDDVQEIIGALQW